MLRLWNFRKLGTVAPLRKLVKRGFSLVYRHGKTVRIRTGPLRGMSWYVHRDHQFWMPLGAYEGETAGWIMSNLSDGDCFFDIGANAGYFSLLGSKSVGPTGSVVAFEPVPANLEVIANHLQANDLSNVELCPVALSDEEGVVEFALEENNANSHLSSIEIVHAQKNVRETFPVQTQTLDSYCQSSGLEPSVLKIDVEGGEELVLAGAAETLSRVRPKVLVSCHSEDLLKACRTILTDIGYELSVVPGFEHEIVAT